MSCTGLQVPEFCKIPLLPSLGAGSHLPGAHIPMASGPVCTAGRLPPTQSRRDEGHAGARQQGGGTANWDNC